MNSIVIDTNVIYSGLRSKLGASFKLLRLIGSKKIELNISVPLIIEYEDVLKRGNLKNLTESDIDDFINYICKVSHKHKIFFLWRPTLKDPKDDMLLELAVTCDADYIITYNIKDFEKATNFKPKILTPKEFLMKIGEIK